MSRSRPTDTWGFAEGAALTPELTAMRLLGGGTAYEAWLAFDEITYAPVVVKVVRPTLVEDAATLRGLRREIRALADVNHPVVVRGLRHDLDSERPHVVLEHIDGPRLSTLIRRHGPLQEQQYLPLAIDLASALHFLRHVGYVHLDLKPSNIIMGAPARLIDLSVARTVAEAAALRRPVGTDAYMAPEQCLAGDSGATGPASDVWGLGAALYEAVTGTRPFPDGDRRGGSLGERFPQTVGGPPRVDRQVPSEVAGILVAMLHPDPGARPAPHEVSETLEPVLARQPVGKLTYKVRG